MASSSDFWPISFDYKFPPRTLPKPPRRFNRIHNNHSTTDCQEFEDLRNRHHSRLSNHTASSSSRSIKQTSAPSAVASPPRPSTLHSFKRIKRSRAATTKRKAKSTQNKNTAVSAQLRVGREACSLASPSQSIAYILAYGGNWSIYKLRRSRPPILPWVIIRIRSLG